MTRHAPATVAVDGHVHAHACFDPGELLDAAVRGLRAAAPGGEGVLLLAGTAGARGVGPFLAAGGAGAWRTEPTAEAESLRAVHPSGASLLLVDGRQIATRERLEVLALAATPDVPEGLPFEETLARVLESGAVAVIPWGFGKWLGARGARVRAALERAEPGRLFVGDNGGRLRGSPTPRLLREAGHRGIWTLPGSDPLPFPGEFRRAGRRGFLLPGPLDPHRPAESLRARLAALERQPTAFGRGVGPVRFAITQARMQVRVRAGRRARPAPAGPARAATPVRNAE